MNKQAMLQLVRVLEEVQAKELPINLSNWISVVPGILDNLADLSVTKDDFKELPSACGTAACACGYAALDPWFRQRGFEFYIEDDQPTVVYRTDQGITLHWDAVDTFFGLAHSDASFLFSASGYSNGDYKNVDAVLNRIKEFIKQVEK